MSEVICAFCNEPFERPSDKGPAPLYCSHAHRQAAHRARLGTGTLAERVTRLEQKVFGLPVRVPSESPPPAVTPGRSKRKGERMEVRDFTEAGHGCEHDITSKTQMGLRRCNDCGLVEGKDGIWR